MNLPVMSVCISACIVAVIVLRFWQLGQSEGLENTCFIFMRFSMCTTVMLGMLLPGKKKSYMTFVCRGKIFFLYVEKCLKYTCNKYLGLAAIQTEQLQHQKDNLLSNLNGPYLFYHLGAILAEGLNASVIPVCRIR